MCLFLSFSFFLAFFLFARFYCFTIYFRNNEWFFFFYFYSIFLCTYQLCTPVKIDSLSLRERCFYVCMYSFAFFTLSVTHKSREIGKGQITWNSNLFLTELWLNQEFQTVSSKPRVLDQENYLLQDWPCDKKKLFYKWMFGVILCAVNKLI